MELSDNLLMSLCINKAWEFQTLTLPNPSVGAMVVDQFGKILSLQAHQKSGNAHAELLALKEAYVTLTADAKILQLEEPRLVYDFLLQNHQGVFSNCAIYVTLEPCSLEGKTPSCASLLKELKPKEVIIGAMETTCNQGGAKVLIQEGIAVKTHIQEQECKKLLLPFQIYVKNKKFNLFKIAQRLNGDYKSGKISSQEARIFTHNQRSVSSSIYISGNTLVHDNPLLDSRFANKPYENTHLPRVNILTRRSNIPKTLEVFKIHQEVNIFNQIPILGEGFNIVEGGWELFKSLKDQIDMLLLHLSPTLSQDTFTTGFAYKGEILHSRKLGEDLLLWIKNF
ncbi:MULTISPECIES: bifunctional diaminohydroxyphosphoribosylaminopyrimidine deaminase/5-amino-6-(5-phosphoribosylamino)uracil reductase RibD [unclassified Helicobacter]|uniref:bifunctional diaminohydroxyphosphoribosylaminopyrimidine deaminase/5-amino-6-(5-phosphoribosylamino)uracil reductase RibD n=1 Tax=unclassified Helicobacter TaxID=2593540 RepID=UPI000CF0B907|nr:MULTISPECIES: bifunctional diaminohydroxyphosphoribosylaminopyrimidine deaminase/5-amino-6-(5-phosphoribosylamino)uracil reductase RibD [unclassified Helicobacter]